MSRARSISWLELMWEFVRRDAKIQLSYRLQAFFQLAALFSICVTFFFLAHMLRGVESSIGTLERYGGSYFSFAIIGLAASSYIDSSLRSFSSSIRTAQMTGTFEAMLATRTRIGSLVAGSALYTLLYMAVRSGVLIAMAGLVFGVPLHLDRLPALAVIFGLTVTATLALGIFSAGFIVLFKQGDPLTAAISGLSWLLSGVLYPKEILPLWVQRVAEFLPATHTLEASRLILLRGAGLESLSGAVFGLAVFSVLGVPISLLWFAWAVNRARVAGSLAQY